MAAAKRTIAPLMAGELNRALHDAMETDERVHVIGEDIIDPYGGAFKVTKGLSTVFGRERVHTTPISESAIVGIASGMALRGLRPVAEIMFGDFLTLCMDQITNHISKWKYMFNEQVSVPLVIRAPMGGRRGYGPTHSQSIESRFMGLPDLRMLAPSRFGSPYQLLRNAIDDDDPVIFIECKTDYPRRLVWDFTKDKAFAISSTDDMYPTIRLRPTVGDPQLALICYGGMVEVCLVAAEILRDNHEISSELLIYTQLHPLDISVAVEAVQTHGRCVVAEEGIKCFGWGSEVSARLCEQAFEYMEAAVGRVGSDLSPIGCSKPLEESILPNAQDVVKSALECWK